MSISAGEGKPTDRHPYITNIYRSPRPSNLDELILCPNYAYCGYLLLNYTLLGSACGSACVHFGFEKKTFPTSWPGKRLFSIRDIRNSLWTTLSSTDYTQKISWQSVNPFRSFGNKNWYEIFIYKKLRLTLQKNVHAYVATKTMPEASATRQ